MDETLKLLKELAEAARACISDMQDTDMDINEDTGEEYETTNFLRKTLETVEAYIAKLD